VILGERQRLLQGPDVDDVSGGRRVGRPWVSFVCGWEGRLAAVVAWRVEQLAVVEIDPLELRVSCDRRQAVQGDARWARSHPHWLDRSDDGGWR
jgi:hypothetical protein